MEFNVLLKLFLRGSAYRAYVCAVTARDALVSIDLELAITLGNARSGATVCTCTARDALITNLESHCKILRLKLLAGKNVPYIYFIIYCRKIKSVLQKSLN